MRALNQMSILNRLLVLKKVFGLRGINGAVRF